MGFVRPFAYALAVANDNLGAARKAKNDEFYTQYHDIEKEMRAYLDYNADVFRDKIVLLPCDDPEWSNFTKYFAQNFETLGLKKLISTSYAPNSKPLELNAQPTLFEMESPQFDASKAVQNGKIFTLHRDTTGDNVINVDDLEWEYLEENGDFRSTEVTRLRDEADIIITNPPFSLFREFLIWLIEPQKLFMIIGNMNAIGYKEVFPLIRNDEVWLGATAAGADMVFRVPEGFDVSPKDREKAARFGYVGDFTRLGNAAWFANIDHGRRHQPIPLMSMEDNIKFSKHKEIKGIGYKEYANYDAIEVPFTDAIPSDYDGVMGVPITFLSKYNPDQFEIIGMCENMDLYNLKTRNYSSAECKAAYLKKFSKPGTYDLNASGVILKDGLLEKVYQRILICHRKAAK
jgi:hypothetical protein